MKLPSFHLQPSLFVTLLILSVGSALTAQRTVTIDEGFAGLDASDNLLLIHRSPPIQTTLMSPASALRYRGVVYTLTRELSQPTTDEVYTATAGGTEYQVAFTDLPLILIRPEEALSDDNRVRSVLSYAEDVSLVTSPVGVRYRGEEDDPKRGFDLEFREVEDYSETANVQLGGLRNDDDWVLFSLYRQPLRTNAYAAHALWLEMASLAYQSEEPEARPGADVAFTEVFIDDDYYGVLLLSEEVDRKQLQLKSYQEETNTLRGELYEAEDGSEATNFEAQDEAPDNEDDDYGGWEIKYPDPDEGNPLENLHSLVGFVANSSEENFRGGAASRFQLDNLIDYELFINALLLTGHMDNRLYLARYTNGSPYFYIPWELGAGFGTTNGGERRTDEDLTRWLDNELFKRLEDVSPERYQTRRCDRFQVLRRTLLSTSSLTARLNDARFQLVDNGALAREAARWPGSVATEEGDYREFTESFIADRLAFLDMEVCARATSLPFAPAAAPALTVYPNPAIDRVTVERETGVAEPYLLFNAEGRQVASGTVTGRRATVSLEGLPTGVYVLRIGAATGRVNVR